MNQSELQEFFSWCEDNLRHFFVEHCDESTFYYLNETHVGGWAGDCREFYLKHSDEVAAAIRMMDAAKAN